MHLETWQTLTCLLSVFWKQFVIGTVASDRLVPPFSSLFWSTINSSRILPKHECSACTQDLKERKKERKLDGEMKESINKSFSRSAVPGRFRVDYIKRFPSQRATWSARAYKALSADQARAHPSTQSGGRGGGRKEAADTTDLCPPVSKTPGNAFLLHFCTSILPNRLCIL